MDRERWQRTRELFEHALDLPETERDAWLRRECDDITLRDDVRAMLVADARTGTPTSLPERVPDLIADYAQRAAEARLGRRYGAWRVERVLGEGGMGTVYLAERIEGGFAQRAALKVVRTGFAQADVLARLAAERQILAGLEHPNIARLLDGGADASGDPYLALEYVEGVDLRAHCDSHRLGLDARLALFLTVCDAVAYAHGRLVVHRDLKPSNILVSEDGSVKLLDFGVAKLIEPGIASESTVARLRLFTPEYAAPEQIAGGVTTTAVDIYSLGVLLFELLTGHRPYRNTARSVAGIEHAVLHDPPLRPSTRVVERSAAQTGDADDIARLRGLTPASLRRSLRGDLDAIVLKALRKHPDERYASVRLLADDVRAHLARRPVLARRGSTRYRMGRFVQRHALAVGFASLAVCALIAGLGAALWQARAARVEAATSREALAFMQDLFELADPEAARGRDVTARELLEQGSRRIRSALVDQPEARAALLRTMGSAHHGLGLDDQALPLLNEALALARAGDDADALHEALLARAAALQRLGRFQDVLDDLTPPRAALAAGGDSRSLRAAAYDYHLGRAAQALGQHERAEAHYVASLAVRERRLGLADAQTQDVAGALVSLYELHRRHDEALALAQRAYDAFPLPGALDDAVRARAVAALAMVRSNVGPLSDAEALRREALAIYRTVYGDEHTITVGAVNDLASVLFAQRRYAEVAPMFEQVLAARRRIHDANHPTLANAANNVAYARLMLGDAAGALPLAQEALRIREAAFGHVHTGTVQSVMAVASVQLALGELDAAESGYRDAIDIYRQLHGEGNAQSVTPYNGLARVHLARGVPPHCDDSAAAMRLSATNRGDDKDARTIYTGLLHAACLARRGDRRAAQSLPEALRNYRAAVRADDPYLEILDAIVAATPGAARG
ncbi:protein kinase domain-containing protein [Chiayiivirga flava]|uniref:Serine/threonine-protein kinase n=1 Tax=Chiayiivirga flava TaxID=659595 RepID=A0A7W8FYJ9_9GAMM|nr:serine/threonine-protein kinase [Chiayiivirga flava]